MSRLVRQHVRYEVGGAYLAHGTRGRPAARARSGAAPSHEHRWHPLPLSSRIENDSDPCAGGASRAPRHEWGASCRRRCASRRRLSHHDSRRLATRLKIVDTIYSGIVLDVIRVYLPAAAMLSSNTFAARRKRAASLARGAGLLA